MGYHSGGGVFGREFDEVAFAEFRTGSSVGNGSRHRSSWFRDVERTCCLATYPWVECGFDGGN